MLLTKGCVYENFSSFVGEIGHSEVRDYISCMGGEEGRKLNSLAEKYVSARHRIHFLFLVLP